MFQNHNHPYKNEHWPRKTVPLLWNWFWYLFTFMECNSEPDTLEALGLQPFRVRILVDSLQYTHKVSSDFYNNKNYTLVVIAS